MTHRQFGRLAIGVAGLAITMTLVQPGVVLADDPPFNTVAVPDANPPGNNNNPPNQQAPTSVPTVTTTVATATPTQTSTPAATATPTSTATQPAATATQPAATATQPQATATLSGASTPVGPRVGNSPQASTKNGATSGPLLALVGLAWVAVGAAVLGTARRRS